MEDKLEKSKRLVKEYLANASQEEKDELFAKYNTPYANTKQYDGWRNLCLLDIAQHNKTEKLIIAFCQSSEAVAIAKKDWLEEHKVDDDGSLRIQYIRHTTTHDELGNYYLVIEYSDNDDINDQWYTTVTVKFEVDGNIIFQNNSNYQFIPRWATNSTNNMK